MVTRSLKQSFIYDNKEKLKGKGIKEGDNGIPHMK